MKTYLFTAVSAIALAVALPVFAEEAQHNNQIDVDARTEMSVERTESQNVLPEYTKEDVKRGLEKAERAVTNAAEDTAEAAQDMAEGDSYEARFIDRDGITQPEKLMIDSRRTASHLLGQDLLNTTGDKVGSVEDIVLDADGRAMLVVVNDGGFLGLGGKKAAFDFGVISHLNQDGEVIAPLSEAQIDTAANFSYDRKDGGDNVRVIPAGGYSVKALLDADIMNNRGEDVADLDDIVISNGKAERMIISFNEVLGMGGDKAAMDFGSVQMVRDGDAIDLKLTARQTGSLEAYKASVSN